MSFLGDLVNSIGGDKAPAPPVKPPSRPVNAKSPLSSVSKSAPSIPSAPSTSSIVRPVYKGTAGTATSQQSSSLKRKAEEAASERPVKLPRPCLQTISDRDGQKPSKLNGSDAKPPSTSKPTNGLSSPQPSQSTAKPPAKIPARGSYAEIMARAKEAQQSKTPSQIGVIKHQATDKVKTSKLAERKREDQEKGKNVSPGHTAKGGSNGKVDPRRRSISPVKKGEPGATKPLKAPRPPLHAPAYKGTMGQTPKKAKEDLRQKKQAKYDEYLGTDEEDEGDYDDYGYGDDIYSNESDMEGGFDELEAEESAALRAAKEDDARELALENKLKQEKLGRKQKLTNLAKKQR